MIRHFPDGAGTHRFLRSDNTEVVTVYLPPRLTKAERIEAAERLIALCIAWVSA